MDVSFLQINNSFAGQNYLPYSAALLTSYFKTFSSASDEYNFKPFIYKRDSVNNLLSISEGSKVIVLSLYAWNARLTLAFAKTYKSLHPDCFIIVGGPSVPDNSESFLRSNPFIDIALHNEGEVAFKKALEIYASSKNFALVPSASFIKDNVFLKTENAARIKDLSQISSPFLSGSLDKLISSNTDEKWIGLWETNRGCPFTCSYCDWGSATGSKQMGVFPGERLKEEMEWFSHHSIEYIFCCDANFGMFKRDPELAKMVGQIKEKTGYPHALSVQNTKNSTERSYETQKILCDYGLNKGVTLSMQTLSDEVLKNIKRSNIKLTSYFELQKRFIKDGVPTYSDLILALPGETYSSFLSGMCNLIESGQHSRIQFNNLSILPNAEMAKASYREEFGIKTVISDIVNMHGTLLYEEESTREKQELVIETKSLTPQDWRKVRSICWLTAFLYFDKIAQIPVAICNGLLGVPLYEIINALMKIDSKKYPHFSSIIKRLDQEALKISNGGAEYIHSKEWLNIYWPLDEYLFIKHVVEKNFDLFYSELKDILNETVQQTNSEINSFYGEDSINEIIQESCYLNNWLLNIPGKNPEKEIQISWNIGEAYISRINGRFSELTKSVTKNNYRLTKKENFDSFDSWLQNVVWYGNKRGDYLNDFESF